MTQPNPRLAAVGVSGVSAPGGWLDRREPNRELRARAFGSQGTVGLYDRAALADPVVAQCVEGVVLPIRKALESADVTAGDGPRAEEIADFVRRVLFEDLEAGFAKLAARAARNLVVCGFDVGEVVARYDAATRRITLRAIEHRPPWSIERWLYDERGLLAAVEQWAYTPRGGMATPRIPVETLALWTHGAEGNDPTGRSMLRPAHAWIEIKDYLRRLLGIWGEREALGVPTAKIPRDISPAEKKLLEKALRGQRAGEQSYLMVPEGVEVDWKKGNPEGGEAILEAIAGCDLQIRAAFLQGFQSLGTTQTGSRSVGEVMADPYVLALEAIAGEVLEPINGLVCWLVNVNFGPQQVYPYVAPPKIRGEDVVAALRPLLDAKTAGAVEPRAAMVRTHELLGLEAPAAAAATSGGVAGATPAMRDVLDRALFAMSEREATGTLRQPPGDVSLSWRPPRALTAAESVVSFGEIAARFDASPRELQTVLGGVLARNRSAIESWARKGTKGSLPSDLPKKVRADLVDTVARFADSLADFGKSHAERELEMAPAAADRSARAAAVAVREAQNPSLDDRGGEDDRPSGGGSPGRWRKALDELARTYADRIADDLLAQLKTSMVRATARPTSGTMAGPLDVTEPVNKIIDDAIESWGVARTTGAALSTEAVSTGRAEGFAEAVDAGAELQVQYSAILDANTCAECMPWDGKVAPSWEAAESGKLPPVPNPRCESTKGPMNLCRCLWVASPTAK